VAWRGVPVAGSLERCVNCYSGSRARSWVPTCRRDTAGRTVVQTVRPDTHSSRRRVYSSPPCSAPGTACCSPPCNNLLRRTHTFHEIIQTDNRQITISQKQLDRFQQNLMRWCTIDLPTLRAIKKLLKFAIN